MVVVASLAADSMSLVAMGVRARLLVVLCLLGAGAGMAQSLPPSSPPPPPPPTTVAPPPKPTPFGRTMSTVITVSISVFFFLLFFCAYINQCRFAQVNVPPGGPAAGGGPFRRGKRGLDPAVVATFPIVPYREIKEHKIGRGVLECAVCLTEFEECDDLRLLPHCSHAFHPECIDPWLEARVTCPLCRANLEKPAPAPVAPPAPEQVARRQASPLPSPPRAVVIPVQGEGEDSDEEDRQEEAIELEMLRSERRAARLPKSHSTGHSLFAASAAAAARNDHERFTLRLPHHVREEVLRLRRLRHATSLIDLAGMSPEGSSRGGRRAGGSGIGNGNGNGGKRWQSFLARTMSWARGGGDGSVRKGWDGSTRRGRDDPESSRKGAASPVAGRP